MDNKLTTTNQQEDIIAALMGKSLTRITKTTYLDVWQAIPIKATMAVAEIQNLKTPEISTINRGENSTEPAITIYEFVIIGLLEFYGCEWSNGQIRETAELLFSEYYWFHIAELKHLVVNVKTGAYGKVYGKFNPAFLMDCFAQYAEISMKERAAIAEIKSNEERYNERWGSHDERLTRDKEAYRIGGLVQHEKSKIKNDGKVGE